jgi:outer membrane protein OmpA-like peptidoglycan-associated protein
VPGSIGHTSDEVCIAGGVTVTLDTGSYTVAAINDNGTFASAPGSITGPSTTTNPTLQITGTGVPGSALADLGFTNGQLNLPAGASLSTASLTLGQTSGGVANVIGTGSLSVAGPIALLGGEINGSGGLAVTQTGSHTFVLADGGTFHPLLYGSTITTPNDISFSGTTMFSGTTLTTTGNLVLAPGAALTQTSSLTASGVVTSGSGGTIAPAVHLTGTTSTLGGNLSVGGLSLDAGQTLTVPASVTLTTNAGSGQVLGTVNGAGVLDIAGGTLTLGTGGVITTSAIAVDGGGTLTTTASSVINVGGVSVSNGTWNATGPATIGASGLNLTATSSSGVTLQGTATVLVAGDVTVSGAQLLGGGTNLVLTQVGAHSFSIGNGTHTQSYVYNSTVTTPNAISESGTTLYNLSTVTTTGNLVLAPSTQLTQNSSITAAGLTTTAGVAPTVAPSLTITKATSSLAGDLSVQDLTVASGGTLYLPSPRILTVAASHKLTVQSGGILVGDGTLAGDLVNQGVVSPGTNAGGTTVATLTATSYTQSGTGLIAVQESASGNDKVAVTGTTPTAFSGTVNVSTLGGYVPPLGNSLTVVSAPSASGAPVLSAPLTTTDDLTANHYATASASGTDVVVVRPAVAPAATVTPSTPKLVITTGGTFTARCGFNVALVKTCAVTAKSANGVVLATGTPVTVPAGAATVSETLKLTAAGVTAAKAAGGVTVLLTATVTPVTGSALVAKSSLVVVNKTIKVTLLGGVLFASNSATLSAAGKKALVVVAKKIQGAKVLECDGHTAKTGNPTGEHKLGLQRATVACGYIKAEIKLLKLKPILKYFVKSYGATRPVSKNQALNRRVEFLVTN